MISTLWLIGMGTGSPAHVTLEGMAALREAAVILLPEKGPDKEDLSLLRREIIAASGSEAQILTFDYPTRDPGLPYQSRVAEWHDQIALRWQEAVADQDVAGPVALLVWGDPSLYDSTLRIAERLQPIPSIRVVPGITAIQALTAAHGIPLNTVNGAVHITTGRRLHDHGWPEGQESVVVMLDGDCRFQAFRGQGLHIWWGAYLGSPRQLLHNGALDAVADEIITRRAEARARHGWIMDTYLMRRLP